MSKQDRQGVRTPQDLERKYDLASLVGIKQAIKNSEESINKTNKTLEEFMGSTLETLGDLQSQVDGNITTWFESGIPTLTTPPASEWTTDTLKNEHLGDLYYDQDTGYAYRFAFCDGSYTWITILDNDVAEALAIANEAKDTADGKRRVFIATPTVPYDVGDLWLYNEELYVCTTASTTTYNPAHFEKATKYTDDSALHSFVDGEYADDLQKINTQIDQKAETWYQSADPALNWITTDLKKLHVGDIWFNTTENKNYIYSSSYTWQEVDGVPDSVYDQIDGKAQIFSKQPVPPYYVNDLYVQGASGDIYVCKTERLTGSYSASDWVKASKYTDDSALSSFIGGEYADDLEAISKQIDKKSETWYQSTDPATNWNTDSLKKAHVGDLWYNTASNKSYIYSSAYAWEEANGVPDSVYDKIDGKAQIFTTQPTTPYHVNDLYVQGSGGDIFVCKTERLTGSYVSSDWVKASKYTDDSALRSFISGDYADDLQAINSQIDKKAETWYQSSDPATNWTTTEQKAGHVGDLWYNTTAKKSYLYTSSYAWQEVDGVPDDVYDQIDGKAQIFTSQPKPPYHVGDMYAQGTSGDILVCQTERLTGSYSTSDWKKASKYTDDTGLYNFVNVTFAESMKSLEDLIDTKITTWYYSGVPTLNNLPALDWLTDEAKTSHIGDLYYDKATGYTYRFTQGTVFSWEHIIDKDLTEALALASSASDTADSKRRIFTAQPAPPYDNGDLWFRDQEIYICQISKAKGEAYADKDFIIATKYTDDTLASQVGDNLEIVRGTVATVQEGVDAFKIDFETTVKSIDDRQQETIESMERMSYTFGTNDLHIASSTDPVNTRINQQGLKVYTYNELQALFNHRGAGIQKLIVVGDAQLGNLSIVKAKDASGNDCTDINYLVSNVQTLHDLEGE